MKGILGVTFLHYKDNDHSLMAFMYTIAELIRKC